MNSIAHGTSREDRSSMTTRIHETVRAAAAAAGFGALLAIAAVPAILAAPTSVAAQEADGEAAAALEAPEISGSTVLLSSDVARLELELSSGGTRAIELSSGEVRLDGEPVASYEPGGGLERAWRALLRDPAIGETESLGRLLADWQPPADVAVEAAGPSALLAALDGFDPAARAGEAAGRQAADAAADAAGVGERVTIVPRAGSIAQLAERLRGLNETLGRVSGEEFDQGDFALVVHDDYRIAAGTTVQGDVALLGGRLIVAGEVDGDVLVLGGDLVMEPGASVFGDVRSMGGLVETAGATVTGEILTLSMDERVEAVGEAPPAVEDRHEVRDHERSRGPGAVGRVVRNVERSIGDLVGTAVWILALTLLGALLVYFAPTRLEAVASEARADVLRSFGVGLAGQLLFFPILLLLVVLIVTWLVVPFYLVAVAVAVPAGYLAVARGLGEVVVSRDYGFFERFNLNRHNTYYYVLDGVIVLLAPFALAAVLQLFGDLLGFLRGLTLFLAIVLTWAAATTGLGAVIVTRGGGIMRDLPGFRNRRRRSVPLDDLRAEEPTPEGEKT